MRDDAILRLLVEVKRGEVSVEDARAALEGASLTEEQYEQAIDHGVFNEVAPGTIVRASIRPSGASWLVMAFALWGLFFTLYWAFTLTYGLMNGWDQQQLSFHLAMTLLTVIILGILHLRFVMPDLVIVKHRRNKFIPPKDTMGWHDYES